MYNFTLILLIWNGREFERPQFCMIDQNWSGTLLFSALTSFCFLHFCIFSHKTTKNARLVRSKSCIFIKHCLSTLSLYKYILNHSSYHLSTRFPTTSSDHKLSFITNPERHASFSSTSKRWLWFWFVCNYDYTFYDIPHSSNKYVLQ